MINNEKAILNAKLNKSESEKNTGKKMDKKPSLLNKFIKGGITLAVAASLFACTTNSKPKVDENTYNFAPMIHNEYEELEEEQLDDLIENVDRLILVDSRHGDETYFLEVYDRESYADINETLVIEGTANFEDEYTLSFPAYRSHYMVYYSGNADWIRKEEIPLIGAGERSSIRQFVKHPEISNTLKFNEINGELIGYLDMAALENYVEYQTNKWLEKELIDLPTPINTDINEAYDFEKLNIVIEDGEEWRSYNLFEGLDIPEGYTLKYARESEPTEKHFGTKFYNSKTQDMLDLDNKHLKITTTFKKESGKYEKGLKIYATTFDKENDEQYYYLNSKQEVEDADYYIHWKVSPMVLFAKPRYFDREALISLNDEDMIFDIATYYNDYEYRVHGIKGTYGSIENLEEILSKQKVKQR